MQLDIRGQAFNGRDLGAVLHDGKRQARDDAPPVDENGAGTALAMVAAFLGSGEIEIFAKRVEQSGPRPEGNSPLDAVDMKRDVEPRRQRKLARVLLLITQRHPDLPLANADMQNHGDGKGVPAQVAADRIAMSSLRGKSCRPRPKSRNLSRNNSRPLVAL